MPMNAIGGMTEIAWILLTQRNDVNIWAMRSGPAPNLPALLNDILDLSKIESRPYRTAVGLFFLARVCGPGGSYSHAVARQKELQLRDAIDSDVPERVTGDSNRVRQVLLNPVGYAIKFTGRGRAPFMS